MSWSCRGHLYAFSNVINSGVRFFLNQVVELMKERSVDIMWLHDARFLSGHLDAYLPLIQDMLPHCRVYQFPTRYVHTGARHLSFNQMGGAIAIVTHQWHGYVTRQVTDPTGNGLLNALDIDVSGHKFRLVNAYMVPLTSGLGPATLLSRLQSYMHGATAPAWAKRLSPIEYQYAYLQQLLQGSFKTGRTTVFSGDFNHTLSNYTGMSSSRFHRWVRSNALEAPAVKSLHQLEGYYT